jgi:vacuolar-type H+-ATPase subunit I/STV1
MSKNTKNVKQAAAKNETTATINIEQLAALQNAILAQDVNAIRTELAKFTPEQISADGRLGFLAQAGNNVISTAEKLAKMKELESEVETLKTRKAKKAEATRERTELEKIVSSGARRAALAVIIAPAKSAQEQQCILNAITLLSNETSLKSGSQRQLVLHARNILEFATATREISDLPEALRNAIPDIERIATALWDKQCGLDDKGEQITDLVETMEDKSAKSILTALGFEVESGVTPENLIKLKA